MAALAGTCNEHAAWIEGRGEPDPSDNKFPKPLHVGCKVSVINAISRKAGSQRVTEMETVITSSRGCWVAFLRTRTMHHISTKICSASDFSPMSREPVIAGAERSRSRIRPVAITAMVAFLTACATAPQQKPTQYPPAAESLRDARSIQVAVERRAADYLHVAAVTAPLLGSRTQETPAVETYNAAAAELTILLRSSENDLIVEPAADGDVG